MHLLQRGGRQTGLDQLAVITAPKGEWRVAKWKEK